MKTDPDPIRLVAAQLDAWEPMSTALSTCQILNQDGAWVDFTYEARRNGGTWLVDIGRNRFEHTFTAWLRQRRPRNIEMLIE